MMLVEKVRKEVCMTLHSVVAQTIDTTGQEAILLQREDYIQRIAEGIYQTVIKAYEKRG